MFNSAVVQSSVAQVQITIQLASRSVEQKVNNGGEFKSSRNPICGKTSRDSIFTGTAH